MLWRGGDRYTCASHEILGATRPRATRCATLAHASGSGVVETTPPSLPRSAPAHRALAFAFAEAMVTLRLASKDSFFADMAARAFAIDPCCCACFCAALKPLPGEALELDLALLMSSFFCLARRSASDIMGELPVKTLCV